MSLTGRYRRPEPDDQVPLAAMSLLVAAAVVISRSSEDPVLSDALVGLLIVLVVAAFRGRTLPNRAGRAVFAMVLGLGLWLMLAGVLGPLRAHPPTGPWLAAVFEPLEARVPEAYRFALGWGILSIFSYPFTPGRRPRA